MFLVQKFLLEIRKNVLTGGMWCGIIIVEIGHSL